MEDLFWNCSPHLPSITNSTVQYMQNEERRDDTLRKMELRQTSWNLIRNNIYIIIEIYKASSSSFNFKIWQETSKGKYLVSFSTGHFPVDLRLLSMQYYAPHMQGDRGVQKNSFSDLWPSHTIRMMTLHLAVFQCCEVGSYRRSTTSCWSKCITLSNKESRSKNSVTFFF